jgi:hypothetical protein
MPRNFPNWLTAYGSYTSDSESPPEFHFWTGVWVIAGALRRRVWLDMRKFQWTPNFYIILVGPPGVVSKSTTSRTGVRLLEKVDGIKFGPPSITWQKLTDSLAAAVEHMKWKNHLGDDEFLPMSCLTIQVSELGTFLKMDDTSLVDVLVDLWDGQVGSWGHSTKTSGDVVVKNPWLNILGCTTPAWLKEHFPQHLIGGGLTSRIIFVYGDVKARLVPYPDEEIKTDEYRLLEQRLVEDLKQIAMLCGEYRLSPEARTWGHDWYAKHWGNRTQAAASSRYEGYLARKQTHLHKIALVLAAAESNEMVVHRIHLEKADLLLTNTEPHMARVFDSIGVADEARRVHELLPFLKAYSWLSVDELFRHVMNVMSQRDFEDALKSALKGGLIVVAPNAAGRSGLSLPSRP